ncbi:MAG: hypothetical protein KAI29_20780 [Cyclobacteriaceae bacterium]|nr:hypothetical protein [Cyclobacteriaceae bacterium]
MRRKNFKISDHLSYYEVIKSQTAIRRNINNEPDEIQLDNIRQLAENIFEPLREIVSTERGVSSPLRITSCFRSQKLNTAIGGSRSSAHCKGSAMDIDIDGLYDENDLINADLFYIIEEQLPFDQLIWEFGDENNPNWVHVGYRDVAANRMEILRAVRGNDGRTSYEFF